MASQSYGSEGKALLPLRYIAGTFLRQAIDQIEINMSVQHIWPFAPYATYPEVNEYRAQHKSWHSTGEGIRSFRGFVYEADERTGLVTLGIRYADYLRYVDIGVGAGRTALDVQRSKKVNFRSRYTRWAPSRNMSSRPAIRPEANHLATRLERYVRDWYDQKLTFDIDALLNVPINLNLQ